MPISPRVYRSAGLLIATLAAGLVAGAARPDATEEQEGPPYVWIPYSGGDIELIREALPSLLRSPCDEIPAPLGNEIHDCQRFVRQDGTGALFGSLIGIFPDIGVLQQSEAAFRRPQAVAFITNAGGSLRPEDTYTDYGYPALQIQPKTTGGRIPAQFCLWMMTVVERGNATWRAAITPNEDQNLDERQLGCVEAPDLEDRVWSLLRVTPQRYPNARPNEYPATARWMWTNPEGFNGEHYIVVKCGDGQQCAITSPTAPALPTTLEGESSRVAIAGWSDAQFLAVGSTGNLHPGSWGVVRPRRRPEPYRSPPSGWRAAAEFLVYGDPGVYQVKLGLSDTGAGVWESQLMIEIPATGEQPRFKFVGDSETTPGTVRTSATGHGPHGSARWRWSMYDETIWVPCYQFGCCDIDPGD